MRGMFRRLGAPAAVVGAFFLCGLELGCARPVPPDTFTGISLAESEVDGLWSATLQVLPRMGFVPERQDRALGLIETQPVTSQHFFEGWRHDVDDSYSFAQASLQTIERKVTVRFRRMPDGRRREVLVQVDVFRRQPPERQLTSTSAALVLYSSTLPPVEYGEFGEYSVTHHEPLGRDAAMERYILERIMRIAAPDDFEYISPLAAPTTPATSAASPAAPTSPGTAVPAQSGGLQPIDSSAGSPRNEPHPAAANPGAAQPTTPPAAPAQSSGQLEQVPG